MYNENQTLNSTFMFQKSGADFTLIFTINCYTKEIHYLSIPNYI